MIEHRFTAAAATYDLHDCPQRELAERLLALIPPLHPGRILDVGAGTGLLTQYLLDRYPDADIDALDMAPGMVEFGCKRFQRQPRVTWRLGDARHYRSTHRYDLIVSNAALQWVPSLPSALAHLVGLLEPGGAVGIGVMLSGTLAELHTLRGQVAPSKKTSVQLPCWKDVLSAVGDAGVEIIQSDRALNRVGYESAAMFLRILHNQGVTGGHPDRGMQLLNRTELSRLVRLYEELYSCDSGVTATYEYGVVVAVKNGRPSATETADKSQLGGLG